MKIKIERNDGVQKTVWVWSVESSDPAVETIRQLAHEAAVRHRKEDGYKGFLLIHCDTCGKDLAVNWKYPRTERECECGATQKLEGLAEARFQCPRCGKKWQYQTNHTEREIHCPCIECGYEMKARWSDEENLYLPEE